MADTGFFKGTSADQDRRFSDKEVKLLKSIKFPQNFDKKVDMRKVNLNVIRPWVAKKIVECIGFEDEVVLEYAMGLLEDESKPIPDPKRMQISLTGFLTNKTPTFMSELWDLLLEAQEDIGGVPRTMVEQKKEELRQAKASDSRAFDERDRRARLDEIRGGADSRGRGFGRGGRGGGGRGRGRGRGGFDDDRGKGRGYNDDRGPRRGFDDERGPRRDQGPPRRRSPQRSRSRSGGRYRSPPRRRSPSRSLSRTPPSSTHSSRSPPRRRPRSPSRTPKYRNSRSPPRRYRSRSLSTSRRGSVSPPRGQDKRGAGQSRHRRSLTPPARYAKRGANSRSRSPPRRRDRSISRSPRRHSRYSPGRRDRTPQKARRGSYSPTPPRSTSRTRSGSPSRMDLDNTEQAGELKIKGQANREHENDEDPTDVGALQYRENQLKEQALRNKVIRSRRGGS